MTPEMGSRGEGRWENSHFGGGIDGRKKLTDVGGEEEVKISRFGA